MAVKGKHFVVDGAHYPGVSTILRLTQSYEKIQALARWRERVGQDEAQRITQAATTRGSLLHKITETHLKGEDAEAVLAAASPEKQVQVSPLWVSVQTVLPRLSDPFLVESLVWHDIGHYAGIVDLACTWQEETGESYPVVLDWKTSSRPKRVEYLEDYILQLTAYGAAINRLHETQIRKGILVICSPEAVQTFHLDLPSYWSAWMKRLQIFWYRQTEHPLRAEALTALADHYANL